MKKPWNFLVCTVLSAELCVLLDVILAARSVELSDRRFAVLCVGILLLVTVLIIKCQVIRPILLTLAIVFAAAGAGFAAFQHYRISDNFQKSLSYHEGASDKAELYSNRKVLLIAPHEDDDLNLLGGVMEEYIRYGSDFYVVFLTNGDYFKKEIGEIRIEEAIALYRYLGVPDTHVIFLGYGDTLQNEKDHIYNASENEVITSRAGLTETYGVKSHPPYTDKHSYTVGNLFQDLKSVILDIRPDVIYCVDYDPHADHRACSLLFEKAMGQILVNENDYSPEVYKGFAYSAAWNADNDFFSTNIQSTQNAYTRANWGTDLVPAEDVVIPRILRWEERRRLPVRAGLLSRALRSSGMFQEMLYYDSQNADSRAISVVNGDKIFWKRETNSLCRDAALSVSSGDASLLNDFMLLDSRNILDLRSAPYDGVWLPDNTDADKTVRIDLKEAGHVGEVVLYDNPDEDCNVLNARILLDNGTRLDTGPLDPAGAATRFIVDGYTVSSLEIQLVETEGESAGLTEIEVFQEVSVTQPTYIKLTDRNDNFVYDYITGWDGQEIFQLYSDGSIPELSKADYALDCDNEKCEATIEDGKIVVRCPRGQACQIRITMKGTGLSDCAYVQNPSLFRRAAVALSQKTEYFEFEKAELLHFQRLFAGKTE